MIGTKLTRGSGKNAATFTITGQAGTGWVLTRTDQFEPPRTVSVAELETYKVENGRSIETPDLRPIEEREREAWQRLGDAPSTDELHDAIEDPATLPTAAAVALGLDELRSGRQDGTGSRYRATAEDHFTLSAQPSKLGPSQDRIDTAARNIAHDLLLDADTRHALQAGDLRVHPAVLAAARELLGNEAAR